MLVHELIRKITLLVHVWCETYAACLVEVVIWILVVHMRLTLHQLQLLLINFVYFKWLFDTI